MSEVVDGATCTAEGCAVDIPASAEPEKGSMLQVQIVSDAICPWCYVAKGQFEHALARLPEGVTVSVEWKPFELNPHMPPEGMDRIEYRSRKFGSWEHSQRLDAQVSAAAAQVGLRMRHDLMRRTPNTFNAHRLIWLAAQQGVQDAVVEGLFSAYFVEGRDVGNAPVLGEIAERAGMHKAQVAAFLVSDQGRDVVASQEMATHRRGLNGVPTFIINGRPAFSGALRAELMLDHLLTAVGAA